MNWGILRELGVYFVAEYAKIKTSGRFRNVVVVVSGAVSSRHSDSA